MTPRAHRSVIAVIVMMAGYAAGAQTPDVAAQLRAYLVQYEPQLGALVAEERFEQTIRTAASGTTGAQGLLDRRVLVSDMGFQRLPGNGAWLGHRRVRTVSGRLVPEAALGLDQLYSGTEQDRIAASKRIAEENARYNVGHPRTINVPTLPLDLLHPRHAAAYSVSVDSVEQRQGKPVVKLTFREGKAGSLVAHQEGTYVRTQVEAWVEVGSGALHRARVRLTAPVAARADHVIDVEFDVDAQLGILVPSRLRETFWASGEGKGTATYSKFRRFETAARIVPPRY